jgi:hypothetical protein
MGLELPARRDVAFAMSGGSEWGEPLETKDQL